MNCQQEIINYISDIGKIPRKDIDEKLVIYNSGILFSLKLLELMSFIEKQYNIIIKPEELIEDNFKDIQSIVRFIHSKTGIPGLHN
jgi:acyl carrier protein